MTNTSLKSWIVAVGLLMSSWAQAQDLTFDNISESDLKDIVSDFSGVFAHTSGAGAGSLGTIFGFEVGLLAAGTQVDRIEKIVKREDPAADDLPMIPSGGLLGRLTVPFGLTLEALLIPEIGDDDFKFQNSSVALLWTATDGLLSFLPFSLGTKVHYTKTDLKFQTPDPVTSTDVGAKFSNTIMGVQILASQNLLFAEPYIGVGYLQADGDLSISGSNTIYNFTTSTSASKSVTSPQFLFGSEFKFLILKLGFEYSHAFDVSRYAGKLTLFF